MNVNTTSASNLERTNTRAEPPAAPMLQPISMPSMLPTLQLPPTLELPEDSTFRRSPNTVHSLLISPETELATEDVERVAISVRDVLSLVKTNSEPVDTSEDSPTGCS